MRLIVHTLTQSAANSVRTQDISHYTSDFTFTSPVLVKRMSDGRVDPNVSRCENMGIFPIVSHPFDQD